MSSSGRYQQTAVLFDASSATVTTDKTDYAPGQTVTITGTGWLPGETVTLNIHRDTNDPPDTVLTAVADANGNITNSEYVCQEYDLGVTFLLTATGQTSGYTAQTTFTDARKSRLAGPAAGPRSRPLPSRPQSVRRLDSAAATTDQHASYATGPRSCTITATGLAAGCDIHPEYPPRHERSAGHGR